MKKKENRIPGLEVYDSTSEDLMLKIDRFLNNMELNVVSMIYFETLLYGVEKSIIKDSMKKSDLCIIGDKDVLSLAEAESEERIDYIKGKYFLHDVLAKVEKMGKSLYILATDEKQLETFEKMLGNQYFGIECVGKCIYQKDKMDSASVVNEINACMPHVIVSLMETPIGEEFILNNKDMLLAKLWLGLGTCFREESLNMVYLFRKNVYKKFLHRYIKEEN